MMMSLVQPPDLMIYLKADLNKLTDQIKLRGRDYESNISPEYLASLNTYYENFISDFKDSKIITVDINDIDIMKPADFERITKMIDRALLYG